MVPEEQMKKLEEVENVLGGGTRRRRIPRKRMMRGGINVQGVNPYGSTTLNPVYGLEEFGFEPEDVTEGSEHERYYMGGTRRRRIPRKRTSKRGGKKSKHGGKKSKRSGKKTRRMRMRGGIVGEGVLSDLVQRRDALKT
jgi:hypothetical protein